MKKRVAAVLLLFSLSLPAQAVGQCSEGLIHYMPYCLTQSEYDAIMAPVPLSDPAPVLVYQGVEQWRHIVEYFWPSWAVERMLRIMDCESSGDPYARNPSSSATGLFQIMKFWQTKWPGDYTDPWTNGAVAFQIWLEADLYGDPYAPWACKG